MKEAINRLATMTATAGFLVFAPAVMADQESGLNLRGGAYVDEGDPLIGIDYQIPMSARFSVVPNAEYVFVDEGDLYTFNIDSRYDLNPSASNPMWVGAGVGAIHRDFGLEDDTDPTLNLLWGMDFATSEAWTPFISSKAIISDESEFAVNFGVRFGAGGSRSTAQETESDSTSLASNPQ